MQATVAPPCPVPLVEREARATKDQKTLYAAQCIRLKAMFAACRKASEVVAILALLPPGSGFQVFATSISRARSIAVEGCRGFGSVLGPTLSSTLPPP